MAGKIRITSIAFPDGDNTTIQYNNDGYFGGATQLFWDKTNNRLGIGTSTPSSGLEVSEGSIIISHSTSAPSLMFKDLVDDDWFSVGQNRISDEFHISSNSVDEIFTITKAGLVGIGCSTPNIKLCIESGSGINLTPALRLIKPIDGNGSATGILLGGSTTGIAKGGIFFTNTGIGNYRGRLSFACNNAGDNTEATLSDTHLSILYTGNVGIGTITPATSAKLELSSTVGALLLTRLTTTQRNALTAINGMLLYDSTLNKFQSHENGAWGNLGGGDFSDGGEAGSADRTLGNTDNFSLGFKTNDAIRLTIAANGHLSMATDLDISLLGAGQFKMVGGIYAMVAGGTDFRVMTPGSTVTSAQKYGFNRKSAWSLFATDTDNVDEMLIEMNIIQQSGSGQRAKTGMKINHYSQPDNGGDVSGLLVLETGGGSAITCYKTHMMRPSGFTDYSNSEQGAFECGSGDDSQAGLFMSGMAIGGAHSRASECIWCRIDNAQSKGILITPNNSTFDTRQAFAVGTINRNNSSDGNLKFVVELNGTITTAGDIRMNNSKALKMKNNGGTYKNMLELESDDTLRIGWELGSGKLMVNIDGGLKTLSIDGNGFVKAA